MEQTSAELSECSGCQHLWREREEPDVLQPEDLSCSYLSSNQCSFVRFVRICWTIGRQ